MALFLVVLSLLHNSAVAGTEINYLAQAVPELPIQHEQQSSPRENPPPVAVPVTVQGLPMPKNYQAAYFKNATPLREHLFKVLDYFEANNGEITLQQLAAFTLQADVLHRDLTPTFQHQENQFESYKLMQTSVENLIAATQYWQLANRFRGQPRPTHMEKISDDQILVEKLQAVIQALRQLKAITAVQNNLK